MVVRVESRFINASPSALDTIRRALCQHYFPREIWGERRYTADEWLATEEGQADLREHLEGRLVNFRKKVIPWLAAHFSLEGKSILEVGCGTGASSVALAEQGARVTGIDIDAPSIEVARARCAAYGLNCEFAVGNADDLDALTQTRQFDVVIFFACLEHMTAAERIKSLRSAWEALSPGGYLVVVETPNRLWFFDEHTSQLPFFNWLPDDIAFAYSRFSPREPFRQAYRDLGERSMLSFLRHGRGVSYHEFELALRDAASLEVLSSLALWRDSRRLVSLRPLKRLFRRKYQFESLLAGTRPDLHRGFFQPYLDLIIRKT